MSKLTEAARAKNPDLVSGLWPEYLARDDPPWGEMAEAVRALASEGEGDRVRNLVETAVEEKELEGGEGFEDFIIASAPLVRESEPLRKALVEVLRDRHLMFPPLEQFLKMSGLKTRGADVSECWRTFRSLMLFREGGYLHLPTFGTGKITRVTRTLVTADFPEDKKHDMQLSVVLETATPLPPSSLAVSALENPGEFMDMLSSSPGDFLEKLMSEPFIAEDGISKNDLAPLSARDVPEVGELWKLLRKAASAAGGFAVMGDRIVRMDDDLGPLERVRSVIREKKVPVSEKVRRVQSILKSSPDISGEQPLALLPDALNLGGAETGALFELCWILTDRGRAEGFREAAADLMERKAPRAERALSEILSSSCRKKYVEIFLAGDIPEEEKKLFVSGLRRPLWEHAAAFLEKNDPALLESCLSLYMSDPASTDLFLWSLAYVASGKGGTFREEEAGPGMELFLDNLPFATADTQKKIIRLLLGPLKDRLMEYLESVDTRRLSRYLETFDESATAHNEGLFLTVGRELSGRKKGSGAGRISTGRFWEGNTIFSGREAIRRRREDILRLKQVEIPAAADAIGVAASHGDLSENAEYAAAMERRDLLLSRLRQWSEEIAAYKPYPADEINTEIVSPGVSVTLRNIDDPEEVRTFDIVGPLDADPDRGRINYMAPLGRKLLGLTPGDTVTLPDRDDRKWRLVSITVLDLV